MAPLKALFAWSNRGTETDDLKELHFSADAIRRALKLSNDSVLHGVAHKFRTGFNLQDFHDAIFMGCNGPHGDVKQVRDLFHRPPFCQ